MSSTSHEDQIAATRSSANGSSGGENEEVTTGTAARRRSSGSGFEPEDKAEKTPETAPKLGTDAEMFFPEGGTQAWLVVLGAWTSTFLSFGYINSYGVFQDYYSRTYLTDESLSNISWIGSLQYCLVFSTGIFTGHLFEGGHFYKLFPIAGFSLIILQMLLSLCTEYYQFILCQGVGIGTCLGIIMNLTICCPSQFFRKRRGVALGLLASGSSIGGVVFPIMIYRLLLPDSGLPGPNGDPFGWTMRIVGFMLLALFLCSWAFLRTRFPPKPKKHFDSKLESVKEFFDLGLLIRNRPYGVYVLGTALVAFGLYTPFTYIEVFAKSHGVSESLAPYMLSLINAGSTFGRILPGILSDPLGRFNITVPCLALTGVLVLILPVCNNSGGLIAFSILYGFASGCFVSLLPACCGQLGETKDIGKMLGLMFFGMGIGGLFGTPITGAILDSNGNDDNWWGTCAFSAAVVLLGTGFIVLSRWMKNATLTDKF